MIRPARPLVAVITCGRRKHYADAQRESWVAAASARVDVRFFLAQQQRDALADEVFLDVGDSYCSLPAKVRAAMQWAYARGYESVLKTDDDTVLWANRMGVPRGNYIGWIQTAEEYRWCSGLGYWLQGSAIRTVATAELTEQDAEDRWVGQTLLANRIRPIAMTGIHWFGKRSGATAPELPKNHRMICENSFLAGEFIPKEMSNVFAGVTP